jgi:hypothetical protein
MSTTKQATSETTTNTSGRVMAGGKSSNPNVFNEAEIYSAVRISVAPILVLLGLAIEGYAIMKKPKS